MSRVDLSILHVKLYVIISRTDIGFIDAKQEGGSVLKGSALSETNYKCIFTFKYYTIVIMNFCVEASKIALTSHVAACLFKRVIKYSEHRSLCILMYLGDPARKMKSRAMIQKR